MTPESSLAAGTDLRTRSFVVVLAALVMLTAWLVPVGHRDLMETDEGRYSEISREMVATGDWVTPRLNGLKYFEKPPLQYWATAVVFEVAGESAFTARFYTALCAFLSVLAVWRTARRLWGREAGDYAGLATASMVWMLGGSQVVTLDMSLTLYLTLALCGVLVAQDGATPVPARRRWMLAVWAAMAGATLTKGLIGLLIPGATLVIYSLLHRDLTLLRRMEWLRGSVLFALIAVPWFVLVSMRNPEFAHFFFIHEHLERYLTTEHHRTGAPYYFVPLLVLGALPWTPLLPMVARHAYRSPMPQRALLHLLLTWVAFVFAFFSLSGSKLPFYLLPIFPALGLLLGPYLAHMSMPGLRRLAMGNAAFWLVVGIVAPLVLSFRTSDKAMSQDVAAAFAPWVGAGAVAIVLMALLAARAAGLGRRAPAVALLAIGSLIGLQFMTFGFQHFAVLRSTRALAEQILPKIDPATELFTIGNYDQTLPFYLDRTLTVVAFSGELEMGQTAEPHKWIPGMDEFKTRWMAAPDALAVASVELTEQLRREGLPMEIVATTPRRMAFRKPAAP